MNISKLRMIAILFVGLFFAHDGFARPMGGAAIAQEKQAAQYDTVEKSLNEIQEEKKPSKYTQTEAHLQVKKIRDLLSSEASSRYIPYLDIMSDCLAKEAELKDTHYVFYHVTENEWRVTQDLYNQLAAYTGKGNPGDYVPLRYGEISSQPQAKTFLVNEIKEDGLINDSGKLAALLISVNFSLFGNVGYEPECSWAYFLREKKHRIPDEQMYKTILDEFNVTDKYINDLLALSKVYDTPEKTILQIFIPKNKVDEIAYISWPMGIPAHEQIFSWAKSYVKKKSDKKDEDERVRVLNATRGLAREFRKEQEKNPKFKDLLEKVEAGNFSVDSYLKMYCQDPWQLPHLNEIQARLIVTPEILMNPRSGIQIYRHSRSGKKQLEEYSQKLKAIVDKIINESKGAING